MDQITNHCLNVEKIRAQTRNFFARGQKIKIYHGSTYSSRAQNFAKDQIVDISQLNNIIEINSAERYALVEPNTPMEKLVETTLKYQLAPPVVMELPGITVGGGVQGGAGESSSFKYGLFHDTCLEYEIVLGNGEILTASPTKNDDLFFGTACSYGTLGIITSVKIKLVPVKNYVRLTYYKVKSFEEAVDLLERAVKETTEFVDGIMFTRDRGVIMVGEFTDEAVPPVATFGKKSDEWFYLHADKISKKPKKDSETIPIKDYFFRYDRGTFWMGYHFFHFYKIPFIRFLRFILSDIMSAHKLVRLAQETNITQRYFIQDLNIPRENILTFLRYIDERLGIYPLWLCPLRPDGKNKLSPNYLKTNLVINVGVYGKTTRGFKNFLSENKDVENKVAALQGRKVLYAHVYYSLDDFWKIYDRSWYNALRERYFATKVFPDIYDKVRVTERYKSSVIAGLWRALLDEKIPVS
jgi:FAD/FMN-containing dehydrogenase